MAIEIAKGNLLVVEGKDEVFFFDALIDSMQLNNIQTLDIGGKTKLPDGLKALIRAPRFNEVISLGVVRDANSDPDAAFQSICDALKETGLPSPARPLHPTEQLPRVTIMILPERGKPGMLEDLCLTAVRKDSAMPCVDEYFKCLAKQGVSSPRNMSKAKVHVFLASRLEADKRLGEAAKAGYWPWGEKTFDEVKAFIRLIVS